MEAYALRTDWNVGAVAHHWLPRAGKSDARAGCHVHPVNAMMTFGTGPTERMFALQDGLSMSVASAAFGQVPLSGSVRGAAYGADHATPRVLLWIMER